MEPRCGNERGDEANEVVVHVARVAQGGGAGGHDGGHLGTGIACCGWAWLGGVPFPRQHSSRVRSSPKESGSGGSPAG